MGRLFAHIVPDAYRVDGKDIFDAEARRNTIFSWVYIIYIIMKKNRLISGPAQRERTVKYKKQEVGADFPEELETHLEGEAQRVLE
jgi:hypothetical protein